MHSVEPRLRLRRALGFAATVGVLGLAPFILPPYPLALLTLALVYGLFAFGLDIAWGRTGIVSIGHAAFFGLGAYGWAIAERQNLPGIVGAVGGILIAVGVAVVIGSAGLGRRALPSTMAILTLALTLLFEQLARTWSDVTNGSNGIVVRSRGLIPDYYVTAALVLLIVAVVWLFVLRGRLGRRALAVNLNPDRAAHLGIDVRGTRLSMLVVSAAVAAAAGAIAAPVMGLVSPSAGGIMLSTQVLVWLAVGGRGTLIGAFAGAVIVTMGQQYLGEAIGSWYLLVLGVIFLIVVRFAPGGLVGLVRRVIRIPAYRAARQDARLSSPTRQRTLPAKKGFAVQARDISKSFGATKVLLGIDLTVPAGEVLCLIGPNGAGKTTLLNIVAGDVAPTAGTVAIFGADATNWRIHRRALAGMGKVFQIPSVFTELSPADNLRLARSEALQPREVPAALGRFERDDARSAAELPLADRRSLELAMVLAWGPEVIILDEPAAGLSHEESVALARLLRSVATETGATLVIIEHDMDIVRELADRVVVLANGRFLAEGTMEEIAARDDVKDAYLGAVT
ncbi:branched-chain amino acid ABC transporter ATP-binding protein/permease [Microbacterium caowuchunii]|uniref:ATP-binding cassette domain-containing protein n=1 Tax=Microbacterium caowuchunii TaxID=2614638 RepID=A0A5N0TS70_9MICO|nr:ATP-binding cassette domain-containing protein [Microbacterium caowuchunii]KAA9136209.1 ATP-binding cassette domain-containing protein [Microbacterium caowuchunii]